tara:strand:- start:2030 stop:2137 length:108 start_codon:yes stop_codon:yes gene_type:complete
MLLPTKVSLLSVGAEIGKVIESPTLLFKERVINLL